MTSEMHAKLIGPDDCILVTGSNGFIGVKLVEMLLEAGQTNIRCFVRPSSRLERLLAVIERAEDSGRVEIVSGDLLSPEDCARAALGVAVIYHLAAGFD
jgi:nucleoside-diphosphate-sugar epimerase